MNSKFRDRDDTSEQVWYRDDIYEQVRGPKWSICEFRTKMTQQYKFRDRWWTLLFLFLASEKSRIEDDYISSRKAVRG